MPTLTAQQAIDLLRANPTAYATTTALGDLVAHVSTYATGSVTVFYGGKIDGIDAGEAVQAMLRDGADIRVLDKTEAFSFLNSRDFRSAAAQAFGTTLDALGTR